MIIFAIISSKANFNYTILRITEKLKRTNFDYTFMDYLKLYNIEAKLP